MSGFIVKPWTNPNTAFSPSDISGLMLWLDASQETGFSDTDPVGTWQDWSGNGYDATQTTAGYKPLYRTGGMNGQPYLQFDTTDDAMDLPASVAPSGTYTVCWVGKHNASHTTYSRVMTGASTNWLVATARPSTPGPGDNLIYYSNAAVATNALSTSVGHYFIVTTTTTGPDSHCYVDGVDETDTSSVGANPGRLGIGKVTYGAFNEVLAGDLYEVVIYTKVIDSTERGNLESYFADKYAL